MTAQRATKAIVCPSCGGTVELLAAGYSVSVACQYCGSTLDVSHPDVALIRKLEQNAAQLSLPLGSKGTLFGIEYQLIGFMRRSIDGEGWDEYLLFNPYHGYRWLVSDEEGWWASSLQTSLPTESYSGFVAAGRTFEAEDDTYIAQVDAVVGEFYWRVQVGDTVQLTNFESGNATLAREQSGDEVNWSVSIPVDAKDMTGFGQDAPKGRRQAMGLMGEADAADDSPAQSAAAAMAGTASSLGWLWSYTGVAAIAFIALVSIMIFYSGSGFVSQTYSYTLQLDGKPQSVTVGPLTFPAKLQKVTIKTKQNQIDNAWIDLDMTLVERTTQESIDVYDTVERYSGTDSDGSWTEGSDSTSTGIASVPKGTYDLVVEASMHGWPNTLPFPGASYTVETKVESGGVFFSNFVLALIALLIPLGIGFWMRIRSRS